MKEKRKEKKKRESLIPSFASGFAFFLILWGIVLMQLLWLLASVNGTGSRIIVDKLLLLNGAGAQMESVFLSLKGKYKISTSRWMG